MPLPFTAYLDTEMNVIHTDQGCSGLKIPSKYGYMKVVMVGTLEQARELDKEYRPCDRCKRLSQKAHTPEPKRAYRRRRPEGT